MYEYGKEWIWNLSQGQVSLLSGAIGLGVLILHFLPTVIAGLRHHHNTLAIFMLNLLLGWTGIGWIIAFIWSLTAVREPATPR